MTNPTGTDDLLLTPGQVAALFGVARNTIHRWTEQGRLPATLTPGGHHRYRQHDITPILATATPRTRLQLPR